MVNNNNVETNYFNFVHVGNDNTNVKVLVLNAVEN